MSVFADRGPQAAMLADGKRLHLQQGPIDLIIEACGQRDEVRQALRQAVETFQNVLPDLVGELTFLRSRWKKTAAPPCGSVAQRMWRAAGLHGAKTFVTPMIAVAGAVADHVLEALIAGRTLERAYVNNGGDIALWLAPDYAFRVGICPDPATGAVAAAVVIGAKDGIGGIATSGWRGRSHSLGIADAVTVLAANAANADAAATLIANAVDLPGSPRVIRCPACELSPDSDLGDRLVTIGVETLSRTEVRGAIERGVTVAKRMLDAELIVAAYIALQGQMANAGRKTADQLQPLQFDRIPTPRTESIHA